MGPSDASFHRICRARDRVAFAQRLLETVREAAGSAAGWAGLSPAEAEGIVETIAATMRAEVELLAREWPEDWPARAAEWLILDGPAKW